MKGARADVEAALPGWAAGRALVAVAYLLVRIAVAQNWVHGSGPRLRIHQGLLAWDGAFYADIARHGYDSLPPEGLRFFPLLPMLGRGVGILLGGAAAHGGTGVVIVANVAALAAGAVLHRLVASVTGDRQLAGTAAWVFALAPPAFVLALGYSEGLAVALSCGAIACAAKQRWGWAVVLGIGAGLCRPVGVLVAIPLAVELGRDLWSRRSSDRAFKVAAVLAPLVGLGLFLAWASLAGRGFWTPVRQQSDVRLRGGFVDPLTALLHETGQAFEGHLSNGLHVPWAIALVALALVAVRRLPISWAVYGGVSLLVALCSRNLDSLERYALGTFPLVVAAASLVPASKRGRTLAAVVSGGGLVMYASLAFLNRSVP